MSCFLPPTHPRVLKLTEDGAVVVGLSGGVSVLTVPLQVPASIDVSALAGTGIEL